MKRLGNNIRKIRELNGFTQEKMSSALGMTQGNYARIEKGEIRISEDRLQKIAGLLNCSKEHIEEFDPSVFFSQTYPQDAASAQKPYISPELKTMYEDRIRELEHWVSNLTQQLESLKTGN